MSQFPQLMKFIFTELTIPSTTKFKTLIVPKGNSNYKFNGIIQMPHAILAKSANSFTCTISPSQMTNYYR